MKVFISWSGEKSKNIAEEIKRLLQLIIPEISVFLSTDDIRSGELWFSRISKELAETNYGILVLTNENKEAPWLLFEAGALFKGVPMNRIIPLLVDLNPSDVKSPLGAFQARTINEGNVFNIIKDIKNFMTGKPDDASSEMSANEYERLYSSFQIGWNYFYNQYTNILLNYSGTSYDLSFMKKIIYQNSDDVCIVIGEGATPNKRNIRFNYEKCGKTRDSNFIMLGYIFDEPQDWTLYCEGGYSINFDIEMKNIRSLKFELKTLIYAMEIPIVKELSQNEIHHKIEIKRDLLKKIRFVKEICFSAFNPNMLEGECEFSVSNLCIEK